MTPIPAELEALKTAASKFSLCISFSGERHWFSITTEVCQALPPAPPEIPKARNPPRSKYVTNDEKAVQSGLHSVYTINTKL